MTFLHILGWIIGAGFVMRLAGALAMATTPRKHFAKSDRAPGSDAP